MTRTQIAGILTMIFGFWLFLIPIYVGYKIYKNETVFGTSPETSKLIKLIFALLSFIIPGILLLLND
ncbi:MAG: hypothetical protein LBF00_03540 [Mycoplasmataceae bacterium]|jgi:hypothetical protein|nr:hypothetical protein [Mycoplasmataceae bacterium]